MNLWVSVAISTTKRHREDVAEMRNKWVLIRTMALASIDSFLAHFGGGSVVQWISGWVVP